jgi:uncharacterized repeat protein (TIGR01451 family)
MAGALLLCLALAHALPLKTAGASLFVTVPSNPLENRGTLTNAGTVQLLGALPTNLLVSLQVSDPTIATVPATVTIVAGQIGAAFSITLVDDFVIDGSQTNTVTASAAGFVNGSATMIVLDNESPPLPANPAPANLAVNVSANADLAWSSGAVGITNDVYFGTNAAPGAAEFLGSTIGTNWSLPILAPNTTYYWQIVARNIGITAGPVWRFTTRGVDHIQFDPVPSPQVVNQPFPVTLTARDEFERRVTNFTGAVSLAGFSGTFAAQLFGDDFEDGSISDWNNDGGTYVRAVTNSTAAGGVRSLTLIGGQQIHYNGVSHTFSNLQPARIQFHVRASVNNLAAGYFVVGAGVGIQNTAVFFYMGESGTMGVHDGLNAHNVPYVAGQWYAVTLLFNWPARRVDFFVDDNLVATNIPFRGNVNSLSTLHLYNHHYSQAWWDEIQFLSGEEPGPVSISPTNSGSFTEGIWAGNITVHQPATNVFLTATDSRGHVDISTSFDVRLSNDLSVAVFERPDPVAVGGYLTNTIVVDNSGPATALGVTVTNFLPPAVALFSAVPSQGACLLVSNRVECGLDSLGAGQSATIVVITIPTTDSLITNRVVVGRTGADGYGANNSAESVTTVLMPTLTISGTTVAEGNTGVTGAVFTVSLAPPSPTNVTVSFATLAGTALAGSDYISTNGILSFGPGQTNQTITVFVVGDTNGEAQESFSVILSAVVNASFANTQAVAVILNDDAPPSIYMRSLAGAPWGTTANEEAMNRVFGVDNWQDLRFETAQPLALFSGATRFIFMDGSDSGALAMQAFLATNRTALEAWVSTGGRLFLNAAPGQGGDIDFGFGVTLHYPDVSDAATASDPAHRIFAEPFLPTGLSWTGTSFAHATVGGAGLASIIVGVGNGSPILGEKQHGNGLVLFGGMTTHNFHSPQPEAANLRANILHYAALFVACSNCPPTILLHPQTRTTLAGGSVTFSAAAQGTAPLFYQWRKDGTNLPNATNITYSVTNVQSNHAGAYSVLVTNFYGSAVSSNAMLNVVVLPPGIEFQIAALRTNNSRVVDHNALTGDDRGGIAVSSNRVFYTGDNSTARFALGNLSGGAALGRVFDSLLSDLRTGKVYSLGNGSNPVSGGGTATTLLEHDDNTGSLTGVSIPLSSSVNLAFGTGIFAGYGRVVLHTGARAFDIQLPSGIVVDLGPVSFLPHQGTENWAYWGVAEYVAGNISLVYVRDSTSIVRTVLPTGLTTTLASFQNLSDMAAITVSVPLGRWYFHHEGSSQFGGSAETIGYADALFNTAGGTNPPSIYAQPVSRSAVPGRSVTFTVGAAGAFPLSYQWQKDGTNLPAATNASLTLANIQAADAGLYSVRVTNNYGVALSSNAVLTLVTNTSGRVAVYGAPGNNDWNLDVQNQIEQTGMFSLVDSFLVRFGYPVPTLDELSQYGAVLVYSDDSFNDANALGNVLADYVDAGGIVVFATFAFQNLQGRIATAEYLPVSTGGQSGGFSLSLVPDLPSHPILAGVNSFNGGSSSFHNSLVLNPGATLVAHWDNGEPLVVTKSSGNGEVVALNFYPPSSQARSDFWDATTDGALLMANALRFGTQLSGSNAPVIWSQPSDRITIERDSAIFSVRAFGTAPLAYQWLKDGTNIPNATNATYVIASCQSSDAGRYNVVITNLYGSVTSSNANLILVPTDSVVGVFDHPLYVDTTNPGVDSESDNVQASIQTLGYFAVPFTNLVTAVELYDQIVIPDQEGRALAPDLSPATLAALSNFVFTGGKLIVHATASSIGTSAGLLNAVFGLSIAEGTSTGPFLRRAGAVGTAFADDPFSLPANNTTIAVVPASLPPGTRNVYSNATGSPVIMMERGSGVVVYLGWDWYDAAPRGAQNGGWLTVLQSALLQGRGAARTPLVIAQPQSQSVVAGSNATLSVLVSGSIPLSYQWRFEGTNLPNATNSSYALTNIAIQNQGNYSVAITNSAGATLSSNAFLNVLTRPVILVQPAPQTVAQGQTATFSVVVSGTPPLTYRWLRNGVTWVTNGGPTLVVTNCQSNAVFRVAVSNYLGSATSLSAALTVLTDFDHDGLPDSWEVQYGFNTNDASDAVLDLDGDGMSNLSEYIARTVPTNSSSVLRIFLAATNQAVLKFVAQSNLAYTVQYRTSITSSSWSNIANVAAQSLLRTVEVTVPLPPAEAERFYRIATPPPP